MGRLRKRLRKAEHLAAISTTPENRAHWEEKARYRRETINSLTDGAEP